MQNTDIHLRCKKNVQRTKYFFAAKLGASSVRYPTIRAAVERRFTRVEIVVRQLGFESLKVWKRGGNCFWGESVVLRRATDDRGEP
jgi:hypothetical protein